MGQQFSAQDLPLRSPGHKAEHADPSYHELFPEQRSAE